MHILFLFEGNCAVYNYELGKNVAASYYNCSAFMSGCPRHMFHSKNVLQCKNMYIICLCHKSLKVRKIWEQINALWKWKFFFQSALISAILTHFEKKIEKQILHGLHSFFFKKFKDSNECLKMNRSVKTVYWRFYRTFICQAFEVILLEYGWFASCKLK